MDDSLRDLGDYYGRLVAHYTDGGFTDEAGDFIPGYKLRISHWEVLNEIEGEHGLSPELYTRVYDAIVAGIQRWAPVGAANMKFMGLALEGAGNINYVQVRARLVTGEVAVVAASAPRTHQMARSSR